MSLVLLLVFILPRLPLPVLLLVLPLLALMLYWALYRIYYRRLLALPGPPLRFPYIFGHALEWLKGLQGRITWMRECANKYGHVVRLMLPGLAPLVLLTNPTDVKNLLLNTEKTNDKDQVMWRQIYPLFGSDSFFVRDGEVAMRRRKFFAALFHRHFYEEKVKIINSKTQQFVDYLTDIVQQEESHRSMDFEALASRLALDINGILSFGHDFNALKTDKYDGCFRAIWNHLTYSFVMPIPYWRVFPTKSYRDFRANMDMLESTMTQIIKERRESLRAGKMLGNDMLSYMVRADAAGEEPFNDKEMRDQVFTFLNGGTDTSIALFTFMIYLLSCDYPSQERARDEVITVLGEKKEISEADVDQLEFCEGVIKETLRLYPPAILTARHLKEPMTTESGVVIPKGADIVIPIMAIHYLEENFENPDLFDPERWIGERKDRVNHSAFLPFTFGPRMCMGHKAAMLEAKIVLAYLLRNFRFKLDPLQTVELDMGTSLHLKEGLKVFISKV